MRTAATLTLTARTKGDESAGPPAERRAGGKLTLMLLAGLLAALAGLLASCGGGEDPPSEALLDFYQEAEAAAVTRGAF